jgi:hypothetical protein
MLTYGGEDHGLRKRQNQIDYHHRIFEWFDYHLKGEPAARWITDGERYLESRARSAAAQAAGQAAATTTSPQ